MPMPGDDYVVIAADRTAMIQLKTGRLIIWYDPDKDEVLVQLSARGALVVKPRAGNSVALSEGR